MISRRLHNRLLRLRDRIVAAREPDVFIGGRDDPYLKRWYILPRNRFVNVYLHQFMKSDHPTLHDHPYANRSIILEGEYREIVPDNPLYPAGETTAIYRVPRAVVKRKARTAHRVELIRHPITGQDTPVWTLFITGPRFRRWGFHCPSGWKDADDYIELRGKDNTIGAGCGE